MVSHQAVASTRRYVRDTLQVKEVLRYVVVYLHKGVKMIQVPEPESGEIIEITTKKKHKEPLPPFSMVGNGLKNRYGTSLDIIEVCLQLNQSELKLLQFFRDCYASNIMKKEPNPNLVIPLRWEAFTAYLKGAYILSFSRFKMTNQSKWSFKRKPSLSPTFISRSLSRSRRTSVASS